MTTHQEVNREMMIKKSQLWALAGVVAVAGSVYARVSPQEAPPAPGSPVTQDKIGKRVSCSFQNATVAEVLKWLSTQGQSFVADESVAASKRKVTVNIVNQPIEDVLDAIADGLSCKWEKKGEVLVLKNSDIYSVFAPSLRERTLTPDAPMEWRITPKIDAPLAIPKVDSKWLTPQAQKELKSEIERAMQDAKKAIDEAHKSGKAEKMTTEERAQFEKEMVKAKAEIQKAMKELEKELKNERSFVLAPDAKSLKRLEMDLPKLKEFRGTVPKMEQFKWNDKNAYVVPRVLTAPNSKLFVGTSDVQSLLKSLTKAQKDKAAKQGYLKPSDLTPAQRKLLGELPSGTNWSIVYDIDGQKITIKGK
ncbi:MAG: hypothetical protein HONBIEJF_00608 [Fimbriimonadaceae bacterium]|nr:hypothetical protein [Fimbriimonadaceae bacterium]